MWKAGVVFQRSFRYAKPLFHRSFISRILRPIPPSQGNSLLKCGFSSLGIGLYRNKENKLAFELAPKNSYTRALVAYLTLWEAVQNTDATAVRLIMEEYPEFATMTRKDFDQWASPKWPSEQIKK